MRQEEKWQCGKYCNQPTKHSDSDSHGIDTFTRLYIHSAVVAGSPSRLKELLIGDHLFNKTCSSAAPPVPVVNTLGPDASGPGHIHAFKKWHHCNKQEYHSDKNGLYSNSTFIRQRNKKRLNPHRKYHSIIKKTNKHATWIYIYKKMIPVYRSWVNQNGNWETETRKEKKKTDGRVLRKVYKKRGGEYTTNLKLLSCWNKDG